jgi:hypothetical protein
VTVDVEKTGSVGLLVNQMVVPDLVVEGAGCAHGFISVLFFKMGSAVDRKGCGSQCFRIGGW